MSWQTVSDPGLGLLEILLRKQKKKMSDTKASGEQKAAEFSAGMESVAARMEAAKIISDAKQAIIDKVQSDAQVIADMEAEAATLGPLGLTWTDWGWITGGAIVAVLLVTGGKRS